ncbi:Uncharacterised protein [Mycobacteroides abscessus subsp. abscessus]|nr:Uncharacterised protein [Mycobacteroides abscessus subsp. abscessus]
MASLCIGMPNSCATAASSWIGSMVPTSLLAHMIEISATSSACSSSAARSVRGETRPCASTGSQVTRAPSCCSSHSTASITAWCSTALVRMRTRRGSASRRAQ